VLVDGGTVVVDSRQIVRYLYERYGGERFTRSAGELADDLDGELAEACEFPSRVAQ
jgi:glutathione S-transferase